jgi:hypothetical protein
VLNDVVRSLGQFISQLSTFLWYLQSLGVLADAVLYIRTVRKMVPLDREPF